MYTQVLYFYKEFNNKLVLKDYSLPVELFFKASVTRWVLLRAGLSYPLPSNLKGFRCLRAKFADFSLTNIGDVGLTIIIKLHISFEAAEVSIVTNSKKSGQAG